MITRRIREFNVYCEMQACTFKLDQLKFKPKGVIFSGGPSSVYDKDAPHVDPAVWEMGVPILGICYGLQEIAWTLGGKVAPCDHREYGHANLIVDGDRKSKLFDGLSGEMSVWMSHGDQLSKIPDGFRVVAHTPSAPFAGIDNEEKQIWAIQFHPEVTHTPMGKTLLKNFVDICGCKPSWNMESFVDKEIERIRAVVGPTAQVIGAVSGGVDSTVAAAIMHKAIGDRFVLLKITDVVVSMPF